MIYKVNGIDLYTAIGFVPDSNRASSNSFEQPYSIKPVFRKKWDDEDGEDIDLTSPRFKEARVFRLEGVMWATSETDYNTKKATLATIFDEPLLAVQAKGDVNTIVNATLKSIPVWERMTQVKGHDTIVTKIAIELDEVMGVALPEYGLWYGPSSAIPVTGADVMALTDSLPAAEIELHTGTTMRYFSFVIDSTLSLSDVTDLDGGPYGDITSQYILRGSVVIGGVTYDIYTMEVAVPYAVTRRHKGEFS
jgi:hypothetical protein